MGNKMESLHPGYKWAIRVTAFIRSIIFVILIVIWSIGNISANGNQTGPVLLAAYAIVYLIITEIYTRMSYNRWKYKFEPHALKIEYGIIWKKYKSIPYERIQNVSIKRGLLARMLGYSTLEIETAGSSGIKWGKNKEYHSEGHIPAVSIKAAESVSNFLLKKINNK